ncbi:MAG TPA: hypothetical protein VK447_08860 [Myxococcaceae bacterium]|nr:hypothetical protein [Myxococcaceae bacterium]
MLKKTVAEEQSGYTYIPLDPFPAKENRFECPADMTGVRLVTIPEALPDNTARISVAELTQDGNVRFAAGSVAEQGKLYKVTIDYTNSTTVQLPFWIRKTAQRVDPRTRAVIREPIDPSQPSGDTYIRGTVAYDVITSDPPDSSYKKYNIPIYIGIGLRVISQITTFAGNVNISGLGAIGAEAEAKHLAGSLIVQTLGINGKPVSAAIPISSELNRTTVQSSIVAVSSIKTLLYGSDAFVQPRVVGMYLPLPADQKLINAVISALLSDGDGAPAVRWLRPCVRDETVLARAETVSGSGTTPGAGPSVAIRAGAVPGAGAAARGTGGGAGTAPSGGATPGAGTGASTGSSTGTGTTAGAGANPPPPPAGPALIPAG